VEEVKTKTEEKKPKANSSIKQEVVSMRQLLECGVHFGHQTKRWDPKMKKYIFTSRNGIHVIDLQQTIQLIHTAYEFIKRIAQNRGTVLFVGTKKQAQDAIKEEAQRSSMPFVNHRWLGGTLTNISTIRQRINKLKDLEKMKNDGAFEDLSSKEQSRINKSYTKLITNLEGIKDMIMTPSALFVVDTHKEQLAIKEARKLKIPIIGIVDTNANPNEIDYPIPANDDAIRAIKLLCSVVANAVIEGQQMPAPAPEPKKEAKKSTKAEEKKEDKAKKPAAKKESKKDDKDEKPKKEDKAVKEEKAEEKKAEKKAPAKKAATKKADTADKATTEKAEKKEAAKKSSPAKKTTAKKTTAKKDEK